MDTTDHGNSWRKKYLKSMCLRYPCFRNIKDQSIKSFKIVLFKNDLHILVKIYYYLYVRSNIIARIWILSAGSCLLPAKGNRQAEREAAEHNQRVWKTAHGSGQRGGSLHHPLLRRGPECHCRGHRLRLGHHCGLRQRTAGEGAARRALRDHEPQEAGHSGPEALLLRAHGQRSEDLQPGHQQGRHTQAIHGAAFASGEPRQCPYYSDPELGGPQLMDILATGLPLQQQRGEGQ